MQKNTKVDMEVGGAEIFVKEMHLGINSPKYKQQKYSKMGHIEEIYSYLWFSQRLLCLKNNSVS